jgi:hypothetical protein
MARPVRVPVPTERRALAHAFLSIGKGGTPHLALGSQKQYSTGNSQIHDHEVREGGVDMTTAPYAALLLLDHRSSSSETNCIHGFEGALILHSGLISYLATRLSGSAPTHVRTDYKWGPSLPDSLYFLVHTNTAHVLHAMRIHSSVLSLLLRLVYGSRSSLEHTSTGIL